MVTDQETGRIYWTGQDSHVYSIDREGNDFQSSVDVAGKVTDCALDRVERKLYCVDNAYESIKRANLDGSQIETLVIGTRSVGVDLANGYAYWERVRSLGGDSFGMILRTRIPPTPKAVRTPALEIGFQKHRYCIRSPYEVV